MAILVDELREYPDVALPFTTWCHMATDGELAELHAFAGRLGLRRRWFQRHAIRGTTEIAWLRPDGKAMSDNDWDNGYAKAVGVLLDGDTISTPDRFRSRTA